MVASGRFHSEHYRFSDRGLSWLPSNWDFGVLNGTFDHVIETLQRLLRSKKNLKAFLCNEKKNVLLKVVETTEILNFDSFYVVAALLLKNIYKLEVTVNSLETGSADTPRV